MTTRVYLEKRDERTTVMHVPAQVLGPNTWKVDARPLRTAFRKVACGSRTPGDVKGANVQLKQTPIMTVCDHGQAIVSAYHFKQILETMDNDERVVLTIDRKRGNLLIYSSHGGDREAVTKLEFFSSWRQGVEVMGEVILDLPFTPKPEPEEKMSKRKLAEALLEAVNSGLPVVTFEPLIPDIPDVSVLKQHYPNVQPEGGLLKASDGEHKITLFNPQSWARVGEYTWTPIEGDFHVFDFEAAKAALLDELGIEDAKLEDAKLEDARPHCLDDLDIPNIILPDPEPVVASETTILVDDIDVDNEPVMEPEVEAEAEPQPDVVDDREVLLHGAVELTQLYVKIMEEILGRL
jgi:hypothetical protein